MEKVWGRLVRREMFDASPIIGAGRPTPKHFLSLVSDRAIHSEIVASYISLFPCNRPKAFLCELAMVSKRSQWNRPIKKTLTDIRNVRGMVYFNDIANMLTIRQTGSNLCDY
jgi:hypothetical protein